MDQTPKLTNRIDPLQIPLPPDENNGWKPYRLFRGSTDKLQKMACHASFLTRGHCPHPPHRHDEEEILLVLAGEVEITLPDLQTAPGDRTRRLDRGSFVYYPAQFTHTLQTTSAEPANYVMLKWKSKPKQSALPLVFSHFSVFDSTEQSEFQNGFCPRRLFQGPTNYLRKLCCHCSTLTPGSGYEPHVDAYDMAIVVLEGEVETLNQRAGPHSVIFYAEGEPHGMRNRSQEIAKYVVFEFRSDEK